MTSLKLLLVAIYTMMVLIMFVGYRLVMAANVPPDPPIINLVFLVIFLVSLAAFFFSVAFWRRT